MQGESSVTLNTLMAILGIIVIPCIGFAVATIVKVAKLEIKVQIYKEMSESTSKSVNDRICEMEKQMDKGFDAIHSDLRKLLNQHNQR